MAVLASFSLENKLICRRTFTREVVVYTQDCDEKCYCGCWEEVYGFKFVVYALVQLDINCCEDCGEVYGGNPLHST